MLDLRYGTKSCVMLIARQYNVDHNRRGRWFVVSEQRSHHFVKVVCLGKQNEVHFQRKMWKS